MPTYVCTNCSSQDIEKIDVNGETVLKCNNCGIFMTVDEAPMLAGE